MLRKVDLPEVSGELFLSRMPGRETPFEDDNHMIQEAAIDYVLSLTPLHEVGCKSAEYARAIREGELAWTRVEFPIKDFSPPDETEMDAFLARVRQVANDLSSGKRVVIHCGAGRGRTGMVAICVLMAIGHDMRQAQRLVYKAGSKPDVQEQEEWIVRVDSLLPPR